MSIGIGSSAKLSLSVIQSEFLEVWRSVALRHRLGERLYLDYFNHNGLPRIHLNSVRRCIMKGIDSVSDRLFGIDLFGLGGPARNSVKSAVRLLY